MGCKPYSEIEKEHKGVKDLDVLVKDLREMEFADKADMYEETKVEVLDVLNTARPRFRGAGIVLKGIVPKDGTYDVTYEYKKSPGKEYTMNVGGYGVFEFGDEYTSFSVTADKLNELYSDYDFIREGETSYEDRAIDVVNNPEKILEIAEEVNELDEIVVEEWHKNELMTRLQDVVEFHKEALPKILVKVNTEADRNGGSIEFDGSNATIYTNIGSDNRNKSALEVYTHEMIHAITKFAIESRDPAVSNTLRGIREIRKSFISETTEEELAEMMPDQSRAMEQAKKLIDYLANEEVGLHEFVAYANTNPYVMSKLASMKVENAKEEHPDLAAKLIAYVRELYNAVVGYVTKKPRGKNAFENMVELTDRLAKANNRVQEAKRTGIINKVFGMFGKIEGNVVEKIKTTSEKLASKEMPKLKGDESRWGKVTFLMKLGARAFVDNKAKDVLKVTGSYIGLKPEGTIQTIFRDMTESDVFQDIAERLGLLSQKIDQHREFEYLGVAKQLKTAFDRELTDGELGDLTEAVLDTDLSMVWYEYKDKLQGMLEDEDKLSSEISKIEDKLSKATDQESFNLYKDQADGLGYFMVTGKGNIAQMMNAHNIAIKLNTRIEDKSVSNEVVKDIDVLATLYALKYTRKEAKTTLASLAVSENNGVEMLVAYQLAHKAKVEEELFSSESDKFKMIKGYSKETFDRDIDFQIAPEKDEAKLKKLGYKKLDRELGRHKLDKNPVKMAMYVSTLQVKQDLHRVALRYTDTARRGTTVREGYSIGGMEFGSIAADRDINKIHVDMSRILEEQIKGKYEASSEDYGMTPVLNNIGRVADFRYMMSKEDKEDVLKMERRAFHVMGRTYASTYDKKESIKFNDMLMNEIAADAAENVKEGRIIGKNMKEYIDITPMTTNDEVKDIWSVLPGNLKKKYPNGFKVRRDLMHSLLGYRETSIADMPGFSSMGVTAKHVARVAEKIWKEIVKIAKVDIILRVPAVLLGNVTSNWMYSIISGYSPLEIAKLQLHGVRELNDFISLTKEVIDLENLIRAGKAPKNAERELARLKSDLGSNSAKELVDEGFYMSIVEELGLEEFSTTGKVGEFVEDKLKEYPSVIRNGAHLLYLTDKTKVFKTMNMATQYSDFVARYAQYHLMMRDGVDRDVAVKTVRDAFINYNKPNSRLVEWGNQMGFVMFTKYFTRIQKAIKEQGKKNPLKVLFAILGQEFVLGDVEDIYDQSILSKDPTNMFYNPVDTFLRAITPSGAEAVSYAWSKM